MSRDRHEHLIGSMFHAELRGAPARDPDGAVRRPCQLGEIFAIENQLMASLFGDYAFGKEAPLVNSLQHRRQIGQSIARFIRRCRISNFSEKSMNGRDPEDVRIVDCVANPTPDFRASAIIGVSTPPDQLLEGGVSARTREGAGSIREGVARIREVVGSIREGVGLAVA